MQLTLFQKNSQLRGLTQGIPDPTHGREFADGSESEVFAVNSANSILLQIENLGDKSPTLTLSHWTWTVDIDQTKIQTLQHQGVE